MLKELSAIPFEKLRPLRAFEEVASRIKARIVSGELAIGERLSPERTLAKQFGVARNTLREGLRQLENSGLLVSRLDPERGYYVQLPSDTPVRTGLMDMFHLGALDPQQLTEVRLWIETVVTEAACEHATQADIDELWTTVREAKAAAASGDVVRRAKLRLAFHRRLARATGNPLLIAMTDAVLEVLEEFVRRIGPGGRLALSPWRERFLQHLERRDAQAAVAELQHNLLRLHREYLAKLPDSEAVSPPAR